MTPDEARGFFEDDEDPREVFARFDAGPHAVTAPPYDAAGQIRRGLDYIRLVYGRKSVRPERAPDV